MIARSLLIAAALLALATGAAAQKSQDRAREILAPPMLRANVVVTSDIVRIGDVIDNAGAAAAIAIYRAPDPKAALQGYAEESKR